LKEFDVAIIGSGPRLRGAIRADRRAETALSRRIRFGGTCLHRGCIPTKALLHAAEIYDALKGAKSIGISASAVSLDIRQVHAHKQAIVDKLAKGIQFLMKKRKVEVFTGFGNFLDPTTVRITSPSVTETIRAKRVIIATGSTPAHLPHIKPDGKAILDSDGAGMAEVSKLRRRRLGAVGTESRGV
jgi:dihydrolipoamide dehydrogenase